MASPFGPALLVVNPAAGRPGGRDSIAAVEARLRSLDLEHSVRFTEGPGDATRIARVASEEGRRFVVAMGGDGTVNEVVNGMLIDDRAVADDPVLGVIGAGSGCDLIRTFGLPADAPAAASHLAGETTRPLDVGRIGYVDHSGHPAVRYFANIAEAGLGGATAARAASMPRRLGPALYFFAFWATLPGYRPGSVRIEVDGGVAYEGRAVNVVVANARFFGGGMEVSPRSDPADGQLDLLVFNGPKSDSFTMLPRVYRGRHLPHPHVVELKGPRFRVESEQPLEIEADGEVLGTTPATFEILARPMSLKV